MTVFSVFICKPNFFYPKAERGNQGIENPYKTGADPYFENGYFWFFKKPSKNKKGCDRPYQLVDAFDQRMGPLERGVFNILF